MEDQDQSQSEQHISSDDAVGFPTPSPRKKKSSPLKWILILVAILVIAGVIAFVLLQNSGETIDTDDNPEVAGSNTQIEQATPAPTVSPTPEAIDRAGISLQILNGTGITGEANYLEVQLKDLGYSKTDKGNNSSQDETITSVTFGTNVSQGIKDEILKKLEEIYTDVKSTSSSLAAGIDIKIVTGLRKGVTPKPESTPKTSSATAKPTATASATSSPTPTATP